MSAPEPTTDPRIALKLPDDLLEGLEKVAGKIGITRNATLILAARKGIAALAREYAPQPEPAEQQA